MTTRVIPDSTAVETALLALLVNDAQLQALAPDGVWWDTAGENAKRFVIVSLAEHLDVPVFGQRGYEDYLFMVKVVMVNPLSQNIRAASHRVDQLLDDGTLTLDGGNHFMAMFRVRRFRVTEPDAENAAIRWLHYVGYYRVQVTTVPVLTYTAVVKKDAPILFAAMDDPPTATTLADSSGHGHTSGPLPSTTQAGVADGLTGGDTDFCIRQTQLALPVGFTGAPEWPVDPAYDTPAFSVELWLRRTTGIVGTIVGIDAHNTLGPENASYWYRWRLGYGPADIDVTMMSGDGSGAAYHFLTAEPPVDAWVHFVVTCDGVLVSVYRNGVLLDSARLAKPLDPVSTSGPRLGSFNYTARVDMDAFALYNYALPPAAVAAHYAARLVAPG